MSSNPSLFSQYRFQDVLQNNRMAMLTEINSFEPNYVLATPIEVLCDYLEAKYRLDIPVMNDDQISQSHEEQRRQQRDPFDGRAYGQWGTQFSFYVSFEGDPDIFNCRPSTWSTNMPRASVNQDGELEFNYFSEFAGSSYDDREAERIRNNFLEDLGRVKNSLKALNNEVESFHAQLRNDASQQINFRKKKLLQDQGVAASIGFPLKKRGDIRETYPEPSVRRKLPIRPSPSKAPFRPEPELDMVEYEGILALLNSMVSVMERSPKAFIDMEEENLRFHFLIPLNAQYEGQATGETFNYEGKTDILIRVDGKNIFIAECKFWGGAKKLTETIDQLLNYTSWRDTKTAILIFNRNKNFSSVLTQIPEIVQTHPNYVRSLANSGETQFRYILSHRDDPNRLLTLTVMAFEIPT